jgi:hypothetical protein
MEIISLIKMLLLNRILLLLISSWLCNKVNIVEGVIMQSEEVMGRYFLRKFLSRGTSVLTKIMIEDLIQ